MPAQTFHLDMIYQRLGLEKIEPGRHTMTDCGGACSPDFQVSRLR
jgi:hypothetical protein